MEFYTESPVIRQSNVSFVIHIRNKVVYKINFLLTLESVLTLEYYAANR